MERIKWDEIPDLRSVWVFLGVAGAGGFRKGAAELHLSQPAVSAAIGRLERDLGLELFEWRGRRKVLSPAGEELRAVAGPALNGWAALEDRVREALEGRPTGCLRLGAGESSLLYLLPTAVAAYRRQHPEVELKVASQPFEESLSMLRDGSLDLAVRSLSRTIPGVSARPLLEVRRLLITSRRAGPTLGHRPSIAEIGELPFVLPWRGSTTRTLLESALARESFTCRIALEAGSWEAVKRYVAQGVGIGVVPEIVVTPGDRRRLATIPAGHLFPKERYGVLWSAERPMSKAAQAMVETLHDHCVPQS